MAGHKTKITGYRWKDGKLQRVTTYRTSIAARKAARKAIKIVRGKRLV